MSMAWPVLCVPTLSRMLTKMPGRTSKIREMQKEIEREKGGQAAGSPTSGSASTLPSTAHIYRKKVESLHAHRQRKTGAVKFIAVVILQRSEKHLQKICLFMYHIPPEYKYPNTIIHTCWLHIASSIPLCALHLTCTTYTCFIAYLHTTHCIGFLYTILRTLYHSLCASMLHIGSL